MVRERARRRALAQIGTSIGEAAFDQTEDIGACILDVQRRLDGVLEDRGGAFSQSAGELVKGGGLPRSNTCRVKGELGSRLRFIGSILWSQAWSPARFL